MMVCNNHKPYMTKYNNDIYKKGAMLHWHISNWNGDKTYMNEYNNELRRNCRINISNHT